MSGVFEPPPTYADPVIVDKKLEPGDPGFSRFNPIWLKWFLDLIAFVNSNGGGGVIQHNNTGGLQGGIAGEEYHLTNAEHGSITGTKTANTVFAGPASGAAAIPAFRGLVTADLPAGTGTVTSVGLSVTPTTNLSETGSPITTSGTIALSVSQWWIQKLSVDLGETLTVASGYGTIFPKILTNNGIVINNGQVMVA